MGYQAVIILYQFGNSTGQSSDDYTRTRKYLIKLVNAVHNFLFLLQQNV